MFLIIIRKVKLININYYMIYTFIFKKIFKVYKWLHKYIKNLYKYFDILNLSIIFINTQNSLIGALIIIYLLVF